MGSHGLIRKGPWFDECLKIPYLLRWPGVLEPGNKSDFLMNTPDIMPTLLGLLGLESEIPEETEGHDLSRFFFEEAADVFTEEEEDKGGLAYYINAAMNTRGVRNREYFLVVERNAYDEERYILYDLKNDPYLLKDIAAENEEIVKTMRSKLQKWMERCNDWWLR